VGQSLTNSLGEPPLVVGTLLSFPPESLAPEASSACDVIEVRLDHILPEPNWLNRSRTIQEQTSPVILTLRLKSEGGKWSGSDEERLPFFKAAIENLSAVDIEFTSKIRDHVCEIAKAHGKACIVSHHDFDKTPPLAELRAVISEAKKMASIVKVTTMIKASNDIETLRSLLATPQEVPLCIMGMGPLGTDTRITFPTLGSCLTYGYLDKPAAPGQLPAKALVDQLRQRLPSYRQNRPALTS
jgi:3-dehydroquinate dehydratase-1